MINLGVKGRAFVLAFIPMLFITSLLSAYFIHRILQDIDNSINDRGENMAMDLANASDYGLFSGNIDSLKALLQSSLTEDDVLSIRILDKTGSLILELSANNNMVSPEIDQNSTTRTFTHRIILHTTPVTDILEEETNSSSDSRPEILGWVSVKMSTRDIIQGRIQSIKDSFIIIISGIIGSILLALWISRSLTVPISRVTDAVRNIEKGKLDVEINTTSTGEIGVLERGVKSMLGKIRLTQQDLQNRIDEATAGLNNSLKLLERQNTELTEARRDALQASQAKSRFLANISHEIRTPMNGILGFVHLLLNSPVTKEQKEYLNTIDKSANNLLTLIEDILDLSRAEAGKLPLRFIFFNLHECVEEVIMLLTPSAKAKNLEVAAIHYSDTPFYIYAPYERIRQILINLVGNAIKFSESGIIIIRTMLDHESSDPNLMRISVSDQGIGISDEEKKQLFTPFTQLDDSSTRTYGGTGLGLAISKTLANAMEGDIGTSNETDIGSTFWFTFKFKQEKEQDFIYSRKIISGEYRICLYDSNELRNAALSSCFTHLGLNVSRFTDLQELFAEIKSNKNYAICALSLDQEETMNKDVHSTIRHIKDNSEIKLLVFIYNVEPSAKSFILSLGVDACLTRPCLQQELQDTITELLKLTDNDTTYITKSGETGTQFNTQYITDKSKLDGLKILVAEDNPINTKLLLTVLKESGAECLHAINGEEAINIYKENNINLVLMDKQMPIVSGFGATKQIREIEGEKTPVPIIGLTAATTPEELNEFMASGIDDILTKPIATEELIHEIVYWVNHYNNLKDIHSENDSYPASKSPDSLKSDNMNFDSLGMNKELSTSLLNMLIEELPETTSQLKEAFSKNDLTSLREQLHKLLGGLSYCDLPELLHKTKLLKTSVEKQSDSLNNDFTALITEINNTLISFTNSQNTGYGSSITQEASSNSEDN